MIHSRFAGSTCYLAGMYNLFNHGVNGIHLFHNDHGENLYYRMLWENICNSDHPEFPCPSAESSQHILSSYCNFEKITEFELWDYKESQISDGRTWGDISEVFPDIACFIFMINGSLFSYEDCWYQQKPIQATSLEEYKKIVSKNLNQFADFSGIRWLADNSNYGLPPIMIVITQSDLIDTKWIPYLSELIRDHYQYIMYGFSKDPRIVKLNAISLLDQSKISPLDFELPISYALMSILRRKIFTAQLGLGDNPAKIDILQKGFIQLLELFGDDEVIYINGYPQKIKDYFYSSYLLK